MGEGEEVGRRGQELGKNETACRNMARLMD